MYVFILTMSNHCTLERHGLIPISVAAVVLFFAGGGLKSPYPTNFEFSLVIRLDWLTTKFVCFAINP